MPALRPDHSNGDYYYYDYYDHPVSSHGQGANSYGQLGRGDAEDLCEPRRLGPGALPRAPLRVLRGGGGHTVAVTGVCEVCVSLIFRLLF